MKYNNVIRKSEEKILDLSSGSKKFICFYLYGFNNFAVFVEAVQSKNYYGWMVGY